VHKGSVSTVSEGVNEAQYLKIAGTTFAERIYERRLHYMTRKMHKGAETM
jgi:gluconate kinase